MLEVNDINKTSVCPLARVMRKELKNRGIKKLKVVYSEEKPIRPLMIYPSVAEHIVYALLVQNVNVQLEEIFLEVTSLFLPL